LSKYSEVNGQVAVVFSELIVMRLHI